MMYGSVSGAAKELNYSFPAMAFGRRKEETEHQRTQRLSSGLLRYRSAPGSLLGEICEDFHPLRPSSLETEAIFSHLLSPDLHGEKPAGSDRRKIPHLPSSSAVAVDHAEALLPSQMLCNSKVQLMTESAGGDSNLIRQSSPPSGLFCCLKGNSGYGLTSQISFSSRHNALSLITDVDSDGFSGGRHSDRQEKCGGSGRLYVPGYPISSSEESSLISGNLPETGSAGGLKRGRSMDGAAGKNQTDYHKTAKKMRPQISGIVNQLGLPKASSEIAVLEKLLQFQDAIPCKIRAKRGCATHPRSIAERVRRTRISERMKKLQELVPNMDKQTNTSDMLDLAIEYIKDLQRQIRSLKGSGESCSCLSSKQRSCQNFES